MSQGGLFMVLLHCSPRDLVLGVCTLTGGFVLIVMQWQHTFVPTGVALRAH